MTSRRKLATRQLVQEHEPTPGDWACSPSTAAGRRLPHLPKSRDRFEDLLRWAEEEQQRALPQVPRERAEEPAHDPRGLTAAGAVPEGPIPRGEARDPAIASVATSTPGRIARAPRARTVTYLASADLAPA